MIPRYPTRRLVKLFPDGIVTGTVENLVADEPPQFWVKRDDGTYSCHAQRDLKRVGTLYAKLD